jgi:hypothetical protein
VSRPTRIVHEKYKKQILVLWWHRRPRYDHGVHPWGQLSAPGQYRSRRLDSRVRQCDAHDRTPECAHEDLPFKPNSDAPQAASTGTPGDAIGTRAATRAAAIAVAVIVRLPPILSSLIIMTKKKAG